VKSNRHTKIDRCDEYARRSPYKTAAELPPEHPNGLCRVVARVMLQAEIKRLIASGRLA
jgi:hypothetical protein